MSWEELIVAAMQEAASDLFREHGARGRVLQRLDLAKNGAILRTTDGALYVIEVRRETQKEPQSGDT